MPEMKKVPMRQCVGCHEMKNKKDMIRVIRTAENEICIDETGRKNGRGAYICRSRSCLEKAVAGHGLERSLKTKISPDIYEKLQEEMKQLGEEG